MLFSADPQAAGSAAHPWWNVGLGYIQARSTAPPNPLPAARRPQRVKVGTEAWSNGPRQDALPDRRAHTGPQLLRTSTKA